MLERASIEAYTLVPSAIYRLQQLEFNQKPLAATEQLTERLTELLGGRRVPLVVFNCLEFSWLPSGKSYPKSVVSGDSTTSICRYYADSVEVVKMELEVVGKPDLKVIVPDSELLDERIFSFTQTLQERLELARSAKVELSTRLSQFDDPNSPILLWSEYCQSQGLKSSMDYTAENYKKIQNEPQLQKRVRDQVKDSKRYFERNGINLEGINDDEIYERTSWYLAMYMGEGQALSESRAICLNLEDGRVPTWFQRGANGLLPILTPVDSKDFYIWRKAVK